LGEYERAIELYERALEINQTYGDRRTEGNILDNLGSAWLALGDPKRAIHFQQQALAISRELGNRRGESMTLGNLGSAYEELGDFDKAELSNEVIAGGGACRDILGRACRDPRRLIACRKRRKKDKQRRTNKEYYENHTRPPAARIRHTGTEPQIQHSVRRPSARTPGAGRIHS